MSQVYYVAHSRPPPYVFSVNPVTINQFYVQLTTPCETFKRVRTFLGIQLHVSRAQIVRVVLKKLTAETYPKKGKEYTV